LVDAGLALSPLLSSTSYKQKTPLIGVFSFSDVSFLCVFYSKTATYLATRNLRCMNISFYTKKAAGGSALVMMTCTWAGERLRLSTGVSIASDDKLSSSGIAHRGRADLMSKNHRLQEMRADLVGRHSDFLRKQGRQPIAAEVKRWLRQPKAEGMTAWMERWIADSRKRVNERTGRAIHERTLQKYRTVLVRLRSFMDAHGASDQWDTVTMDFYRAYVAHLQELGLGVNTVGKEIQVLKTMMAAALEDGAHESRVHESKSFVARKVPGQHVALTDAEIGRLMELDLTGVDEDVRDLMAVACYTGLRWSDLERLSAVAVREERIIRLHTYKTDTAVVIPVVTIVLPLFEKRDWRWKVPSGPHFNRRIKELCRMAGITQGIEVSTIRGGKWTSAVVEKCEMVSSHTGRRTFATIAYFRGAKPRDIMRITGHKTEVQFFEYIQVRERNSAEALRDVFGG